MTEKTKTKKETSEERITNAFYMLAKVVEQNTMMYEALIIAINTAPTNAVPEPVKTTVKVEEPEFKEPAKEHTYTLDDCKTVLVNICTKINKQAGFDHLAKYKAKKASEVAPVCFENFILTGQKLIDGGYDA